MDLPPWPTPRKHAFTLWTQYQATSDLSVGGGVRYVGSLRRGAAMVQSVPRITPRGYWVADAKGLGYRVNSNLDLQLNMY